MARQERIRVKDRRGKRRSSDDQDDDQTPATDRREIRKDIRRVWWPDA